MSSADSCVHEYYTSTSDYGTTDVTRTAVVSKILQEGVGSRIKQYKTID